MTPSLLPRIGWEVGQVLGVVACVAMLAPCVTALRPRRFVLRVVSLGRHEVFGWIALAAASLHAVVLLAVDPRVIEHLRSTAPLYEAAGVLAWLLLAAVLTTSATAALRRRVWPRHRPFQQVHLAVAGLAVVLVAVHVVGTDRYARAPWGALACVGAGLAALLAMLGHRGTRRQDEPAASMARTGPHPRRAGLSAAGVAVIASAVALVALAAPRGSLALREVVLVRTDHFPLDFPHERHTKVACLTCHHNYKDGTGMETCVSCHRGGRTDLRAGAEARFHDFCLSCHRNPPVALDGKHGPTTGCVACHPVERSGAARPQSGAKPAD